MTKLRIFNVTTERSPEGIEFAFVDPDVGKEELLHSVTIKEKLDRAGTDWVIAHLKPNLSEFLEWVKTQKGMTIVELQQRVTFDLFWKKYDDRIRSSKKRSEKLWNKLSEADQLKAYYFIDTYNRNRGNAEKKYCETYLNAEMWNN